MIRLKRVGRKGDPSYRVVVTEKHRGPKAGKYIEKVGFYDPKKDIRTLNAERITYWMSVGAKPSDTVYNLLVSEKVVDGKKKNVLPKKSPIVSETPEEEQSTPASDTGEATDAPVEDATPAEETPAEDAPTEEPKTHEAESSEEVAQTKEEAPEEKKEDA